MKTLTLFLSLLFSFPFVLSAQMVGETLQKVSAALDNRQWDQAVTLFRQAVNTNVEPKCSIGQVWIRVWKYHPG